MTALDYILDGLEAELALERELGIRSIEIDRSLLVAPPVDAVSSPRQNKEVPSSVVRGGDSAPAKAPDPVRLRPTPVPQPSPATPPPSSASLLSIAFLHDKPLSPAGVEMMAKIITALKLPEGAAQVVVAPPMPRAKVYVVLGGLALKRWFPGQTGAPGQWLKTEEGQDVLVTNSPEYILRFKTVSPALQKIKMDMWTAIKSVLRRI